MERCPFSGLFRPFQAFPNVMTLYRQAEAQRRVTCHIALTPQMIICLLKSRHKISIRKQFFSNHQNFRMSARFRLFLGPRSTKQLIKLGSPAELATFLSHVTYLGKRRCSLGTFCLDSDEEYQKNHHNGDP